MMWFNTLKVHLWFDLDTQLVTFLSSPIWAQKKTKEAKLQKWSHHLVKDFCWRHHYWHHLSALKRLNPNCEKENVVDAFWPLQRAPLQWKRHQRVGDSLSEHMDHLGTSKLSAPLFLYQTYKLWCQHTTDNNISPTGRQEHCRPYTVTKLKEIKIR